MKATRAILTLFFELLLLIGISGYANAQGIEAKPPKVILQDNFDTTPPVSPTVWNGTIAHFRRLSTTLGGMLYLNGNTDRADTSWLSAAAHISHGEWNYIIDLKLEPTQSNRLDLVLMSDTSNLKAPFSGYLIKAGENGSSDVLRLMRVDEGKMTPLLSGNLSIAQGGMYTIKVIRMPNGDWQLFAGKRGEGLLLQGTVRDTTYYRTGFSGFRMIYTKTNASAFGLGPLQVIRFHPEIFQVSFPAPTIHRYTFDTHMDTRLEPEVHLNDSIPARSTRWISPYRLEALFDREYARGRYLIRIHPVNSQDQLQTQLTLQTWWNHSPGISPGDLLINEYLYHPPEGVPQFVEIYNASSFPLNLKEVELLDASTGTRSLSTQTLWLPPDSLLVVTSDSLSLTTYYGIRRALHMSRFPYLNRSSPDVIKLTDASGRILDSLYYQPASTSYGRSIERIQTTTRSSVSANWKLSEHIKGASPGEKNTVSRPTTPARIEKIKLFRNRKLQFWFNREMDTLQTARLAFQPNPPDFRPMWLDERTLILNFKEALTVSTPYRILFSGFRDAFGSTMSDTTLMIIPATDEQTRLTRVHFRNGSVWDLEFNYPVLANTFNTLYIEQEAFPLVHCDQRSSKVIECQTKEPLVLKPDQEYFLHLRSLRDADGYAIDEDPVVISRPYEKGDLLINEILTQPLQQRYGATADQSQFVEMVNTRGHSVSIDTLRLVTGSGTVGTPTILFFNNLAKHIPAHGFMVLLPDTISLPDTRLIRFFGQKPGCVYVMTFRSTLSLPSEEGYLKLLPGSRDSVILDSLHYRPNMHQPTLRDRRGISLERLSVKMPTTLLSNWNSYGGIAGASPGERNSNTLTSESAATSSLLSVYPKVFSPDNDGREDVVLIRIQSTNIGSHAHVQIFDRHGRHIHTILNGQSLGSVTTLGWNGLDKNGHKVPTGIYIVTLSLLDPTSGRREQAKLALGLIHQGFSKLTFN